MKIILIILCVLFSYTSYAQTITNRDSTGRITGSCSMIGNNWTCKRPDGRITGTSRLERPEIYNQNNFQNNQGYNQNNLLPFQNNYNMLSKTLKFDSNGNIIGYVIKNRNGQWDLFDTNGQLLARDSSP